MLATSSGVAARWMIELGRFTVTKAAPASSMDCPAFSAASFSIASAPSDGVGPGRIAFTVTPVPAARLASPREIASGQDYRIRAQHG
jgi:hypothetical protein